jgi:hypothetical protein
MTCSILSILKNPAILSKKTNQYIQPRITRMNTDKNHEGREEREEDFYPSLHSLPSRPSWL